MAARSELVPISLAVPLMLTTEFVIFLEAQLRDFLRNGLPAIVQDEEIKLNKQIDAATIPSTFLGLELITRTTSRITLLARFTDIDVVHAGTAGDKETAIDTGGLKINLARVGIQINRPLKLTDFPKSIKEDLEIVEFAIEAELKTPTYDITLGGGKDSIGHSTAYLASIDLKTPPLRFSGLYEFGDKNGFVLDVTSSLPFPIPLGNSGLALVGIGLLLGEHFAPRLENTESSKAVERLRIATAEEYVSWSLSMRKLEQWVHVDQDIRLFGIKADIGDVMTSGRLIVMRDSGMTFISYGPTFVFGGEYFIFDSLKIGSLRGAIDFPSQSLFLSAPTNVEIIPKALAFLGKVELSTSLKDQTRTWTALGGYDMTGCRVTLLGILQLWGGFRFVPLQGAAIVAGARLEGAGEIAGCGGGYTFSIQVSGSLGWNPVELGGQLDVRGSVWIKILGLRVGLGVAASLSIHAFKPVELAFRVTVTVELPWPLSNILIPVQIFDFTPTQSEFDAALEAIAIASMGPKALPLAYIHRCSGEIGQLLTLKDDEPLPDSNKVLPDISFDIPFRAIPKAPIAVINRSIVDGTSNEGGVSVSHRITRLEIMKVDEVTGKEVTVPDVTGAWLGMDIAGTVGRTRRLAIPCGDPLGWMESFQYAQPKSIEPAEKLVFQTFGSGVNQTFKPEAGGDAFATFSNLRVSNPRGFDLLNIAWIDPYARALVCPGISIEVSVVHGGNPEPVPITSYDIRFVASKNDHAIHTNTGTLAVTCIRALGENTYEWSASLTPDKGKERLPVHVFNEHGLNIVAIGYIVDSRSDTTQGIETVLKPGLYKLYIQGDTTSSYPGLRSLGPLSWSTNVWRFKVISPPSLRPYTRYSTVGDERLFGVTYPGWNPNPFGFGFGHYQSHLGVVRFRVSYLSKIFNRLWVSIVRDTKGSPVDVEPCKDGTYAGSKLSQEWQSVYGPPKKLEEEIIFSLPALPGDYHLQISSSEKGDGSDPVTIDRWNYRVSAFSSPTDHLKPANRLTREIGPFGARKISGTAAADLPSGFDFDAVALAKLISGVLLPDWIRTAPDQGNPHASLAFMHVIDWTGFLDTHSEESETRLFSRQGAPTLNLVFASSSTPVALLWKTAEPCDWRRVEVSIVQGKSGAFMRRFGVRLLPSPDGCSCLLLLQVADIPVKITRGDYAIRTRFHYRKDGLPSLVEAQNRTAATTEFNFTFSQPSGKEWHE